jgi:hypothetical protein
MRLGRWQGHDMVTAYRLVHSALGIAALLWLLPCRLLYTWA